MTTAILYGLVSFLVGALVVWVGQRRVAKPWKIMSYLAGVALLLALNVLTQRLLSSLPMSLGGMLGLFLSGFFLTGYLTGELPASRQNGDEG